ncbi:MAG: dihydropteroate synthase [Gammaproteobacteria bacterium]|nr:dihydropteroate synthase [Gammaproteobacteria bacterium]
MIIRSILDGEGPLIAGILNLTPDSFSDGGLYVREEDAIRHACTMTDEGADIIDVGGESSRPGAEPVGAKEQIRRVIDVIRRLREILPATVAISIDTTLSDVANTALEAGASIINDTSAGRDDEKMFELAAVHNVPLVLMHRKGTPKTMQDNPTYGDVVQEVKAFLLQRAESALAAGVRKKQIILDPGIGFGKTRDHNLHLMANLTQFVATGYPVLLGTSRKRFMGSVCGESESQLLVGATCSTTALGVAAGVKILRVHDVKPNRQAANVAWAIKNMGVAETG